MTPKRAVRSTIDAETLAELVTDGQAIPAAAFSRSGRAAAGREHAERAAIAIPPASVRLVEAAQQL